MLLFFERVFRIGKGNSIEYLTIFLISLSGKGLASDSGYTLESSCPLMVRGAWVSSSEKKTKQDL